MASHVNNVLFTASSSGTGDFVVSAAVAGYQTPALAGITSGSIYRYKAESADKTEWEIGYGAYTSGSTTLARTTVLYNSAGTGTASGQSGAGSKISFTAAPRVAIVAIKEDWIGVDEANSFTAAQKNQAQKNIGLPAVIPGYVNGLTLSTAGSSATFSVAAGVATDTTAADMMALTSAISKTTSSWAVGTGNGGLDTGSIANSTWYHVFLIKRTDTQVVDVLISTSASAPTMPTNYTLKRRIGSMKTNGSAQWTKFTQLGREFLWDTAVLDVNNAAYGSTSAISTTLTVPTGVQVIAIYNPTPIYTSATNAQMWYSALDTADVTPNSTTFVMFTNSISQFPFLQLRTRTNTSAQIRERSTHSSTTRYIYTFGWEDDLSVF